MKTGFNSSWADLLDENSNLSIASVEFGELPLGSLSNHGRSKHSRSGVDSDLDNSRAGVNLLIKNGLNFQDELSRQSSLGKRTRDGFEEPNKRDSKRQNTDAARPKPPSNDEPLSAGGSSPDQLGMSCPKPREETEPLPSPDEGPALNFLGILQKTQERQEEIARKRAADRVLPKFGMEIDDRSSPKRSSSTCTNSVTTDKTSVQANSERCSPFKDDSDSRDLNSPPPSVGIGFSWATKCFGKEIAATKRQRAAATVITSHMPSQRTRSVDAPTATSKAPQPPARAAAGQQAPTAPQHRAGAPPPSSTTTTPSKHQPRKVAQAIYVPVPRAPASEAGSCGGNPAAPPERPPLPPLLPPEQSNAAGPVAPGGGRAKPMQELESNIKKEKVKKKVKRRRNPQSPSQNRVSAPPTAAQVAKRETQIRLGKATEGYLNYIRLVPRYRRSKKHPRTPDVYEQISKRRFDGKVRSWRRQLHEYDDPIAHPLVLPSPSAASCTGSVATTARSVTGSVAPPAVAVKEEEEGPSVRRGAEQKGEEAPASPSATNSSKFFSTLPKDGGVGVGLKSTQ